jgi:putative FmdB family regulatory protein
MPIYEYHCSRCRKVFEKLHREGDDAAELKCPHCGEDEVQRILSSFSSFFAAGGSSCDTGGNAGFG